MHFGIFRNLQDSPAYNISLKNYLVHMYTESVHYKVSIIMFDIY